MDLIPPSLTFVIALSYADPRILAAGVGIEPTLSRSKRDLLPELPAKRKAADRRQQSDAGVCRIGDEIERQAFLAVFPALLVQLGDRLQHVVGGVFDRCHCSSLPHPFTRPHGVDPVQRGVGRGKTAGPGMEAAQWVEHCPCALRTRRACRGWPLNGARTRI